MAHRQEVDAAWKGMAFDCAHQDRYGRHHYRNKQRTPPDYDELAIEYERLLNEAHAVRTLLVRRDGP